MSIDLQCRVLDGGQVTGMGGFNGKAALEGTFLAPSMLQGKRTGRLLGRELGRGASQSTRPASAPSRPAAGACVACHAIQTLFQQARPGYTHFERAHRVVLERSLDCLQCHAGMHHADPRRLIDACAQCHAAGGR